MTFNEWKEQIKPEKKKRGYLHIDNLIDLDHERSFKKVVAVLQNIKQHQFLPFIKRSIKEIRFRRGNDGKTKRKSKERPIMYSSHIDSHIYSYYNYILINKYEEFLKENNLDESVIAYRKIEIEDTGKGKNNLHLAKEVFKHVETLGNCVVITQDVEKFFDKLNHGFLKAKICKILGVSKLDEDWYKVFRSLTSFRYVEYVDFEKKYVPNKGKINNYAVYSLLKGLVKENRNGYGIPQGSPISGLLANIYMVDFDMAIKKNFPEVFYRRYSDDLLFVCSENKLEEILDFISKCIKGENLSINSTKTFLSFFEMIDGKVYCKNVMDGNKIDKGRKYVDYLGLEFDGSRILLRKNTIQKLKRKQIVKIEKQQTNILKQIRRKPRKNKRIYKNRNNYFKRALETIENKSIKSQVSKVVKDRNKAKRVLRTKIANLKR